MQNTESLGAPLHCVHTVRYFLDQVPPEESPRTPLPNALISPLPQEHVPRPPSWETSFIGGWEVVHLP